MTNTGHNRRLYEHRDRRPHPQAILDLMRERGMSREELAVAVEYDRKTLWRALKGELITYGFGLAIAKVLDVPPDKVMDLDPVNEEGGA